MELHSFDEEERHREKVGIGPKLSKEYERPRRAAATVNYLAAAYVILASTSGPEMIVYMGGE